MIDTGWGGWQDGFVYWTSIVVGDWSINCCEGFDIHLIVCYGVAYCVNDVREGLDFECEVCREGDVLVWCFRLK